MQYVQTELPDKKALPALDARIFRFSTAVAFCSTDTEGTHESFCFLSKASFTKHCVSRRALCGELENPERRMGYITTPTHYWLVIVG